MTNNTYDQHTDLRGSSLSASLDIHNMLINAASALDEAFYDNIIAVGELPADAVKLFKQFTIFGRIGPGTARDLSTRDLTTNLQLDALKEIKVLESRGLVEYVKLGEGKFVWHLSPRAVLIGHDERYYKNIDDQLAEILTDNEMTVFADLLSKIRMSFGKDP